MLTEMTKWAASFAKHTRLKSMSPAKATQLGLEFITMGVGLTKKRRNQCNPKFHTLGMKGCGFMCPHKRHGPTWALQTASLNMCPYTACN